MHDGENTEKLVETAPTVPSAPPLPVHPHWKRHITLLLGGQIISIFGSALVQFAIIWHITLTTKSPILVTLVTIAAFVPQGIISLFGGTLADRVNRRVLIILPDAVIAAATLVLAVLLHSGYNSLWLIFAVVAIRSIGGGFQGPAVSALIPTVVPSDQLLRINSLNSTAQSIIGLAAPATAGAIYAFGGIVPTLFVDVITALIGIGIVAFIPFDAHPPAREQEPFHRELVSGIHYSARDRFIRWLLSVYAVIFVLNVGPTFLVPLMMTQTFGENVWNLSVLEMSFHIGMILGGIVLATLLANRHRMRMLLWTSIGFGVIQAVLPFSPTVWGLFVAFFLIGVLVPAFSGPSITELQERTDPAFMGRVMSQVQVLFTLGMPFGMALFGPFAEFFGVAEVIFASGILTVVFVVWAFYGTRVGRVALATSSSASLSEPSPVSAAEAVPPSSSESATSPEPSSV